jgi:hypothetical protein
MKCSDLKHPMQPIGWEGDTIRFKMNKAVSFILDNCKLDLNAICRMHYQEMFGEGDYAQLMQLIGYSVSGYGDLSVVPRDSVIEADRIAAELVAKREVDKEGSCHKCCPNGCCDCAGGAEEKAMPKIGECEHDWHVFPAYQHNCEPCCFGHDMPQRSFKIYRQCKLCNRLESITVGAGLFERKEEKEGIPI